MCPADSNFRVAAIWSCLTGGSLQAAEHCRGLQRTSGALLAHLAPTAMPSLVQISGARSSPGITSTSVRGWFGSKALFMLCALQQLADDRVHLAAREMHSILFVSLTLPGLTQDRAVVLLRTTEEVEKIPEGEEADAAALEALRQPALMGFMGTTGITGTIVVAAITVGESRAEEATEEEHL